MERLSDYDYTLPEAAIAQDPLADRAAARLLYLHRDTGRIEHRTFREVPEILRPDDLLVLNDTRVTARRLFGNKPTGGAVEALLLREEEPGLFQCLVKPAKRLPIGSRIEFAEGITGAVVEPPGPSDPTFRYLRLTANGPLHEFLARGGQVPLPPYIHHNLADPERYQTVYATAAGSAAAPTAGLHFTPEVLRELERKGVRMATVTLDVSLDTFRPIHTDDLDSHRMHGETCSLLESTREAIEGCEGRVIAVGTTTVRTLEHFAVGSRRVRSGRESTTIFIRPGYRFQIIDGMFTNFHLPRTTMLAMISALADRERVLTAYEEALRNGYRFLSFGDSMLIL